MGKSQNEAKFVKTFELFSKYSQVIIVSYLNVGSRQVQEIRRTLGKHNSILLIGKNTMIKRVVQTRIDELDVNHPLYDKLKDFGARIQELEAIKNSIAGKVAFVFTNEPVFELKPLIEANKLRTAAKIGQIAPIDVTIPPGPTGMDPSQITFFHALSISTKIQKQQIEIVKEFKVCEANTKVTNSQAALLQKLNIKPFEFGMNVLSCYDNGSILNQKQVSINLGDVVKKFQQNAQRITRLSLGSGLVTEQSVPHLIISAFKNLAAIGIQTGYEFEQLKGATSQQATTVQPTQAPAQVQQVKKAEVVVEKAPEPVEEDMDMGGLFDF